MVTFTLNGLSEDRITDMLEPNQEDQLRNSCTEDNGNDIQAEHDKVLKNETNDDDNNQVENEPKTSDNNCAKIDEHSSLNCSKDEEENAPSVVSSSKSSQTGFDDARCSESMPSSDSNKENLDGNSLALNYIEFDPSDYVVIGDHVFGEYDNTDQIPLPQLLKIHVKQLVSGFEFGEATKRRAQENMKTARDKKMNENRMSGEITEKVLDDTLELEQPCCSKTLSERDHKTPHSHKRQRLAEARVCSVSSDKDFCKGTRRVPDCLLEYPDCIEVWVYMIYKEEAAIKLRNPRLFNDFKSVTPRMRAILLDWLMEVAEVYHLRRVTYYLSVDYFDRFLSIRPDIPKSLLQLVGITCLYIAAKVEEIYPPNLSEFSYVCDGACKSKEMVSCELLILNSLGWEVVLTTPSDWLNLYMQLHFKSKDIVRTSLNMDFNKDFIFPQYSAYQFTRASQLMDLFSLDPGFLKFGYSVIAAGAMYFMYGKKIALSVSGLTWQQLQPCADYMEAFYMVIKDAPDPRLHSCLGGPHPEELNRPSTGLLNRIKTGPQNENYSFQTHVACMDYFEKATIYRLTRLTRQKVQIHSPENNNLLDHGCNQNDVASETSDLTKSTSLSNGNEVQGDCTKESSPTPEILEENANLVDDLATLEELTKHEDGENPELEIHDEQNLMSLDEIFELILNQDELKGTNSDP